MSNKIKELIIELGITAIISGIIAYIIVSSIGIDARLNELINEMNDKVIALERTTIRLEDRLHFYSNTLEKVEKQVADETDKLAVERERLNQVNQDLQELLE